MKLRSLFVAALVALTAACSSTPTPSPTPTSAPPPTAPPRLFQVELKINVEVQGLTRQPNGAYQCQQGMGTLSVTPSFIKHEVKETHFEGHVVKAVRFGEGNANWIEYDELLAKRVRALVVNSRFGAVVPTYKAPDRTQVAHPVSFPRLDDELRTLRLCLAPTPR